MNLVMIALPALMISLPLLASAVDTPARGVADPLVIQVIVPLCSNRQINCGANWAGNPGNLETNLYWGAIFGARRFFDRSFARWQPVSRTVAVPGVLEQSVYRLRSSGATSPQPPREVLVVLQAVHGDKIDDSVNRFFTVATQGGTVAFEDGDAARHENVDIAGYAGHNRLMDGKQLPVAHYSDNAIPSFVLACFSERYFGEALRGAGSPTLVMTSSFMAPEGYVIDAVVWGLAHNRTLEQVRADAVDATAKWQRIPRWQADQVFSRPVKP